MLTDIQIKNIQPTDKAFKVSDSGGLYLDVRPGGAKYWRMFYRYAGKQKTLAVGVYPAIGLKDARRRAADAKALLGQGIDPSQQRRVEKLTAVLKSENTFEAVAREWLAGRKLAPITRNKIQRAFENYVFPHIGVLPIADVTPAVLLALLRKLELTGKHETVHRLRAWASAVFRFGIQTQRCERDPAADLRGDALRSAQSERRPALSVAQIPEFLRKLNDPAVRIEYRTRLALRLQVLTFVRPGELRGAAWSEFDTSKKEWRVPAARTKMKDEHIVPLSSQVVAVLDELRALTGDGALLFPCVGKPDKPMSENTLCRAIQDYLGFPVTAHGFRATATSALLELGWPAHVIDRQLGHRERKQVFGAYSHMAQYLEERRRMMKAWGDHLQALEQGAAVIPFARGSVAAS